MPAPPSIEPLIEPASTSLNSSLAVPFATSLPPTRFSMPAKLVIPSAEPLSAPSILQFVPRTGP